MNSIRERNRGLFSRSCLYFRGLYFIDNLACKRGVRERPVSRLLSRMLDLPYLCAININIMCEEMLIYVILRAFTLVYIYLYEIRVDRK